MIALCPPDNCYTFNNEKTESETLLSYALVKKEKFKWSILVKIPASTLILLCKSPQGSFTKASAIRNVENVRMRLILCAEKNGFQATLDYNALLRRWSNSDRKDCGGARGKSEGSRHCQYSVNDQVLRFPITLHEIQWCHSATLYASNKLSKMVIH